MRTADLVDAHDEQVVFCDLPFRRFGRVPRFSGEIATIKCHEDNALLKAALLEPGAGRVMIVDAGGSTRCAVLGDQVASSLVANGWAGIVIHGAVRDSAELDRMEVGVFALATSPKKSAKAGAGFRDVPVGFGGATFAPGGWAYCDEDGVLVATGRLD